MDSDRRHEETDVNILTSRKMTYNLLGNTHKKTQVLSPAALLEHFLGDAICQEDGGGSTKTPGTHSHNGRTQGVT